MKRRADDRTRSTCQANTRSFTCLFKGHPQFRSYKDGFSKTVATCFWVCLDIGWRTLDNEATKLVHLCAYVLYSQYQMNWWIIASFNSNTIKRISGRMPWSFLFFIFRPLFIIYTCSTTTKVERGRILRRIRTSEQPVNNGRNRNSFKRWAIRLGIVYLWCVCNVFKKQGKHLTVACGS